MLQVKKLTSFGDLEGFDFSSVGFFQTSEYLKVFIKHFCKEEDVILLGVYEEGKLIGYGCFEIVGDDKIIKFLGMKKVLGNQELTDYGNIVLPRIQEDTKTRIQGEEMWEKILEWFKENGFKKMELEYVNYELRIKNYELKIEQQEVSPFINLPVSWEEYVSSLEYKNRRELRRKMNRLNNEVGNDHWSFRSAVDGEITKNDFQEFVRLVKLSENEKEKFMTKGMEEFFWDLCRIGHDKNNIVGDDLRVVPHADRPGGLSLRKNRWTPFLNFLTIDSKNAAAILTFENGEEVLAYNSGYDSEFIHFSPGFLSHAFKIKELIEKKYAKYDFLRGNERYKYDLGAKEEKLYKITVDLS